jgi:hypothetical protein
MAVGNSEEQIAEDRCKEIFLALVDAQDHEQVAAALALGGIDRRPESLL